MKFFHLSDLHIGLRLMNRDISEDQRFVFDEIAALAARERPDAILIAGDIYDKAVPSAEAAALFDAFVSGLVRACPDAEIMMISGNHDSAARVNVFRAILQRQKIHMIGVPPQTESDSIERVTLTDEYGRVNFYLLPFVRPSMVKQIVGTDEDGGHLSYNETLHRLIAREKIDTNERNVLVSHQFYLPVGTDAGSVERMDSEIRTVGDIDEVRADVLEIFDYAALGHIHKPMTVGNARFRYCGTPCPCSVSEAGQTKGVIVVDMKEKGNVTASVLPLKPLREVRALRGELADILAQSSDDYVSVTLTDREDLDVIDMQDRLRAAFPNLLEIRRETYWQAAYDSGFSAEEELDPFSLCSAFLNGTDETESALLRDVINTVAFGGSRNYAGGDAK